VFFVITAIVMMDATTHADPIAPPIITPSSHPFNGLRYPDGVG
jgi:hypothetical protein